ncbi:MAG: hypothetical protein ACRBCJ_09130 [Hyphomicrobiaceae bacterium]
MQFDAKWRWTFDDFKVLNSAYFKLTPWRRRSRHWLLVLLVIALLACVFSFWLGEKDLGWAFLAYVVLLLAIKFLLVPWGYRRRYTQQELDGKDIVLTADDAGVEVDAHHGETKFTWSGFPYVTVQDGHTILWQNLILGIAVPDRAFSSEQEARRFAAFAEEKINGQKL